MISVLADENVPRATIALLREAGMDVRSASEELPGAVDGAILDLARSEGRLLLTFDRDFGELIYRRQHEPPPAVVYLRFLPTTPEEPATVFRNLLRHVISNPMDDSPSLRVIRCVSDRCRR